jgi:hypothetical protein
MVSHILSLNKEKNPVYFSLVERQNEIVADWDRIKKKVNDFRIPEFQVWSFSLPSVTPFNILTKKKELSKIGGEVKTLQDKFIKWSKESWNFCDSPQYVLGQGNELDNALTIIHYNSLLLSLINQVNSDMTLLISDYNLRFSEIENSANYWIATTAWALTFIALIISLIGLFMALT